MLVGPSTKTFYVSMNVAQAAKFSHEQLTPPNEVGGAQAIAARTYAYWRLAGAMRAGCGCDVLSTVADQNYVGWDKLVAAGMPGLDRALKAAGTDLKGELDKIDQSITKAIDKLTANLTAAIDRLTAAIKGETAVSTASGVQTRGSGTGTETATAGSGETGGGPGLTPRFGRRGTPGVEQTAPVQIVFNGDIYSFDDFEAKVSKAVRDSYRRGGLQFLRG